MTGPSAPRRILCAHADDGQPMHWLEPGEKCNRPVPSAAEVRAAFPEWRIVLADSGYWVAELTGSRERVVAGTLAQLAEALNELVAGTGEPR